jgi:hypothetical protein
LKPETYRPAGALYSSVGRKATLGLSANCRFDGSVGVFASLATVMQLLAFVKGWDAISNQHKDIKKTRRN